MRKPAVILATALSTVALAGAVGIGVAAADPTPSPTPSASAAPTSAPSTQTNAAKHAKGDKARKARDLTKRALHGEVTIGAKKPRVVDFQRGEVTAVSGTSITVKSVDGFSATYVVDASTKVRHAKATSSIADVKAGDKVRVVATKGGSAVTAKRIADRTK